MLQVTSGQIAKIIGLINRILAPELAVEATVEACGGFIRVEVLTEVNTESLFGEEPGEKLVRAACWLAVRQTIWNVQANKVLISTNASFRLPSLPERATANVLELHMRKSGMPSRLAVAPAPNREVVLNPPYRKFLHKVSGY